MSILDPTSDGTMDTHDVACLALVLSIAALGLSIINFGVIIAVVLL